MELNELPDTQKARLPDLRPGDKIRFRSLRASESFGTGVVQAIKVPTGGGGYDEHKDVRWASVFRPSRNYCHVQVVLEDGSSVSGPQLVPPPDLRLFDGDIVEWWDGLDRRLYWGSMLSIIDRDTGERLRAIPWSHLVGIRGADGGAARRVLLAINSHHGPASNPIVLRRYAHLCARDDRTYILGNQVTQILNPLFTMDWD